MAQEENPNAWLSDFQEVGPAAPAGQNVYVPAKPKAPDTPAATETWTTLSDAEAAAEGLPAGGVYQRNAAGKVQTVQSAPSGSDARPTEAQNKTATLLTRIKGGFADIQDVTAKNTEAQQPGLGETLATGIFGEGLISRKIAGEDRRVVRDAQRDILDALLTLGTGAAYNAEQLEGQLQSYFPQYGDTKSEIDTKNARLERLIASAKVAAGPQWDEVEAAIAPMMPKRESPLTPTGEGAQPEVSGSGETYLTPEDRAMQAELNAAYKAGAPLSELQAIAGRYNRTFPIQSQADLDAARAQGRAINVDPSGRRNAVEQVIGGIVENPVGGAVTAYAVSAANGLLSGGMDELAGVLGMDADTVQAAKELLREKHGIASTVGDISGQAMQLAAGGALGGGARAVAAREIAQGAAYGAGESNDNRLLGAVGGGAGAVVGQQIGKRLVEPAAQAVIGRIARDAGVPPEVVQQTVEEAIGEVNLPAVTGAQAEEVGALARKAISRGPGSAKARRQLAEMAKVNPEAQAAAERLGVDLPVDVLSDEAQMKQLAGMARSQVGSEAETAWMATVGDTVRNIDDAFAKMDATTDIAQVSDDVFAKMNQAMQKAETQASDLRREVDAVVDVRAPVDATNLQNALAETINDLGGIESAKKAMSAEEKKLLAALGEGAEAKRPTYAYLNRVRDDIGKALQKGQGPWTDTNEATLKKYYAALADDRVGHVEAVAGKEVADKLRASNTLFKEMYDKRQDMTDLFGKDLSRGISAMLSRAITQGGKGEAQALNQALSKIPSEMHGRVLASALLAQGEARSARGGFSFANFTKAYQNLRKQGPIYAKLAKAIGPEREALLRDVYAVSRRMADADTRILRTGKANQAMIGKLQAESLMAKVAKGALGKTAATVGGGVAGGPVGAGAVMALTEVVERAGTSRVDKLHRLISSDGFKDLIGKVSEGKPTTAAVNRTANSKPFVKFAEILGIGTPEGRRQWLQAALTVEATPETDTLNQSTIEVR